MSILRIWEYLTCWRHNLAFSRNIYGDEIVHSGRFKRSWWQCTKCGKWESRQYLHRDEKTGEPL